MKLDPPIERALEETGLPYEITRGGKHYKIKLSGRLVGVFGIAARSARAEKNIVAQIRRAAKEMQ